MRYLFSCVFLLFLLGCEQPPKTTSTSPAETVDAYAHIQDATARRILQAAIDHAGGLERWQALKGLQYSKAFALYDSSGALEKEVTQVHDYQFNPTLIDIQSMDGGVLTQTRLENEVYTRTKDGTPLEMDQDALAKSVNSSLYVIGVPFNLIDPEAQVRYLGSDTLSDGRPADVIEVRYGTAEPGQSTDVWRYYFDVDSRAVLANWVQTPDHAAWIDNQRMERINGLLFHRERATYRTDSLGNKTYLRATYEYGDYVVE